MQDRPSYILGSDVYAFSANRACRARLPARRAPPMCVLVAARDEGGAEGRWPAALAGFGGLG